MKTSLYRHRRVWLILVVFAASCARGGLAPSGGQPAAEISESAAPDRPYVVLVSFDGFRHDYLDRGLTPNFDQLAARGARADALIPIFPTKTYPNHYSIATGMYAGKHGIVANEFYDPTFDDVYRLGDRSTVEDGRWYAGEPIWVTAERQGMRAAAMFFVGTEAPVQGVQPSYWHRYDHEYPELARIDNVIEWLRLPPETRPHVITLYFATLDDAGHRNGPESAATDSAIVRADALLGSLLAGLNTLPHGDRVHVIIVSDHGMTLNDRGVIALDEWVTFAENDIVITGGTLAQIHVQDQWRRIALRDSLQRAPNVRVWLREDIPDEWGVKQNPRIGDILVLADEGWLITRTRGGGPRNPATHGYAPVPSMYGIFLAAGPRIRSGVRIARFECIHIYPLLAEILSLRPNPAIDGRLDVLRPILREAS